MFRSYNVSDEMDRMRREMNRMFRAASGSALSTPEGYPAINMWLDGDKVIAEERDVSAESSKKDNC